MKNIILYTVLALTLAVSISACKSEEKKETKDIVVPKPAVAPAKGVQTIYIGDSVRTTSIKWLGSDYSVVVRTVTDKELPLATDEYNVQYYDQVISVKVLRADQSEVFSRTFHKTDFKSYYAGQKFAEDGALLGIVYRGVEDGRIVLGVSIGSPDSSSDMFMPFLLKIDKEANLAIEADKIMDDIDNGDGV